MIESFLEWCSNLHLVVFIRDNPYGMPSVQSFHLLGLTLLLGSLVVMNLRLAGIGMRELPLTLLARQLKPWTVAAMGLMLISGSLIFLATPSKYLASTPFRLKMATLGLALLFHFTVFRKCTGSEPSSRSRLINFAVAFVSLALWFGVGWAGRAIAFVP